MIASKIRLFDQHRQGGWTVLLIAIAGLTLTTIASAVVYSDQQNSRRRLFETMSGDIVRRITPFLLDDHGLYGARGVIQAVGGLEALTSDQFVLYARARYSGQPFPGTRGIALAKRLPANSIPAAISALRARGWPVTSLSSLGQNSGDRYILFGAYPGGENFDAL
jgi:CHASE1-domain containing sensor protein